MEEKIMIYTTIACVNDEYKLSAFLEEDGSYTMTSLDFTDKSGIKAYWDNEDYIYGELYNMLECWFTEKKATDLVTLVDVLESIPVEDLEVVYDILNKGLQLGFYKKK